MDDLPPDLERQAEAEETVQEDFSSMAIIRCACGQLCDVRIPNRCVCGDIKAYWKAFDGRIMKLAKMSLGHLNNSVRMLAAKAEETPAGQRERYEIALDILYAEIGSRDQEISQVTGIMAALTRSLAK